MQLQSWLVCEQHPEQPFEHDPDCAGPGISRPNPNCDWDPDAILALVHCSND
jgi:hypothetical protein